MKRLEFLIWATARRCEYICLWAVCAILVMKIAGHWLSTPIAMRNTSRRFLTMGMTTALPRRALRPARCICEIEVNNVSKFDCSLVN